MPSRDDIAFQLYKGALMVALAKGGAFDSKKEGQLAAQRADDFLGSLHAASTLSGVPRCPECGGPMVKRKRRDTQEPFWGCRRYPKCNGIRPMEQKTRVTSSPPDVPDDFDLPDPDDIPF